MAMHFSIVPSYDDDDDGENNDPARGGHYSDPLYNSGFIITSNAHAKS